MNKKKQYISALLVSLISIAFFFTLFFQEKGAALNEPISIETEPLIEEVPYEYVAKAAYLSALEEIETNATSKEDWFRRYKEVIDTYADAVDTPETIYDKYTNEELDLLFRVVQAEISHGYSFEQKANVCSAILNRVKDGRFGSSLGEVLNEHQFSTISNGAIYRVEVEEKTILACEYVFMCGDTTNGALFFHSGQARSSFSGRSFKYNDGAHNFY